MYMTKNYFSYMTCAFRMLVGRVIWITGASSGIGEQLAYIFARLDCKLILSGTRQAELERVRNRCETISEKCEVLIVQGNIADIELHSKWVKTVLDKFGKLVA